MTAFNIKIAKVNNVQTKNMSEIASLSIFTPSTTSFHPNGLYSTEIFGLVGSPERNRTFAYKRFSISQIHPLLFKTLITNKAFYKDILASKSYAVFDNKTKTFIPSTIEDGETGFAFFIKHLPNLTLPETGSTKRKFIKNVIKKFQSTDNMLLTNYLIIPAGLRDYTIKEDGRGESDEINDLYRRVISLSNLIPKFSKDTDKSYNKTRYSLQLAMHEVYIYLEEFLYGKKKFLNYRLMNRRITDGSANVLVGTKQEITNIGSPKHVKSTETVIGIYQAIKSLGQKVVYGATHGPLLDTFPERDSSMNLVSKDLKKQLFPIDTKLYDTYMTEKGIIDLTNKYKVREHRNEPLMFKDHYLAFVNIYKGQLKVIRDKSELISGSTIKDCKPMTLTDLFYLSIYKYSRSTTGLTSRHPIIQEGSTYPGFIHIRPTIRTQTLTYLPTGDILERYPDTTTAFYDALAVNDMNLGNLNADKDGDVAETLLTSSKESTEEIKDLLGTREYWIDPHGKFKYDIESDPVKLVMGYLS